MNLVALGPAGGPALPPDPAPAETARLLERLKARLDRSFERLGERLPPLDGEVRAFLAGLATLREERPLDAALNATEAAASRIAEAVREQLGEGEILGRLAEGLARPAAEIGEALAKMDGLARDLKLTGLNAELAAARLGETGRAFSVLSRDLVLLTGETSRTSAGLDEGASSIRVTADGMIAGQASVSADLRRSATAAAAAVEGAIGTAAAALTRFDGWLAEAGDRAGRVLDPIHAIMLAIQGEDLLRQGVDHVALVLGEVAAVRREGHPEAAAFEERAAELCATLVDDLGEGTIRLVGPVREQLDCLAGTVEALGSIPASRDEVIGAVAAAGEQLRTALPDEDDELRRLDELCGEARNLGAQVQRLARQAGDLSELGARLRILEVMMRLERARADALAATAPITQRIGETSRAVTELSKRVEAALAALSKAAAAVEEATPRLATAHRTRRARIAERIGAQQAELADGCRAFGARVEGALSFRDALGRELAELRGQLVELEGSRAEAGELAAACRRMSVAAGRRREEDGLPAALLALDARLAALVDRFTLLSHKQLASSIGTAAVEAGDAGGTLTLF